MKQISFLLVGLLAAISVDASAQNAIWIDPTNNVEYELNVNNLTASVKAGDALESDVYPAHEGLTGDIVIPEKVRDEFTVVEIGQGAFMENPGITSITIPKTVTYIDRAAFSECTGCTNIYCYANPGRLGWRIFDYYPEGKPNKSTKFHVPAGYLSKYKSKFSEANVTFVGDLPDDDDAGSIVSTFKGWHGEDTSMLNGIMLTEEGNDWFLNIAQSGITVSQGKIGSSLESAENCLEISNGSNTRVQAYVTSAFPIAGPIAKIIIRAAGISSVGVDVKEASTSGTSEKLQRKGVSNVEYSELKDIVIPLDGTIEYDAGAIQLELVGWMPMHICKITIVQEDAEAATSGKTGDLDWSVEKLDGTISFWENGTKVEKPIYRLKISGTGAMPNYYQKSDEATNTLYYDWPWRAFIIREVVVGEGVSSIGFNAFNSTDFLNSVKLPSSIKRIETRAFDWSGLSEINFPEGLETICEYAFPWCRNLKTVNLPASLTELDPTSFKGNNIQTLTIAEGNPKFEAPNGCNSIILKGQNLLFMGTPATEIPATVTIIGKQAFENNNNLKSFVIPSTVTTIDEKAFNTCYALLSLTIGSGVTSIGKEAFASTTKLADVLCYADPAALEWEDYDNASNFMADKATKIHVKKDDLTAWQTKFPNVNATFVGDLDAQGSVSDGDVDGDGEVTSDDVAMVVKVIASLVTDEKTKTAADVNGDGNIDIADVIALVNLLLGTK